MWGMETQLVNIRGLARELNLPIRWLSEQVEFENIPCLKIGKQLRFNVQAVQAALAEMAAKADPKSPTTGRPILVCTSCGQTDFIRKGCFLSRDKLLRLCPICSANLIGEDDDG